MVILDHCGRILEGFGWMTWKGLLLTLLLLLLLNSLWTLLLLLRWNSLMSVMLGNCVLTLKRVRWMIGHFGL